MALNYRTWITTRVPAWGQAKWFSRFLHVFALHTDALLEVAKQAVKTRFLHIAPDDALQRAGSDSNLPRYPRETLQSYRARLQQRFDDWPAAGTELGLIGQYAHLQALAEIKENQDWDWDGDAANWSRFWVTIPQPHPWHDDGLWDDPGVWDDGGVWDSTDLTVEDVSALRGLVRKFKPPHVVAVHVIVIFDNALWAADLPDGTWGEAANWNPNAIYISVWDGA